MKISVAPIKAATRMVAWRNKGSIQVSLDQYRLRC
jgi:hypothetical protein